MDKQLYKFQRIVCWLIPALIVLAAVPAFGQDNEIVNVSGFRIQVFPFPQSLAGIPMHISFNGTSGAPFNSGAADASTFTPVPGLSSREPQPPDDINAHLSRFRTYLFQYLDVAKPASAGFATDTFSETMIDYRTGPEAGPGEDDQGVSLKIQADVSDKSGALVFVIKI